MKRFMTTRNLIIAAAVLITLACLGTLLTQPKPPTKSAGAATATATPRPVTSTPPAAFVFDATKATGTPTVGATVQNFVKAYGQPINFGTGHSPNFAADQTVILNTALDAKGTVTYLGVLGSVTWDTAQTMTYCHQFLPSDARQFNATGTLTDYHSSVGQVVINNPGQGTCTVYLAQ